jgi:hypothetical protein
MENGSSKSLFTLLAVVIFGLFLSLSYWMFQDELTNVLANVFDNSSSSISEKLDYTLAEKTDEKYFTIVDNGDGTCKLTTYTGTDADLVIPETVNGLIVVEIADQFYNRVNLPSSSVKLKSLLLPNTIKKVGSYAFRMNDIKNLVLPEGLEVIDRSSFELNNTETVQLPNSLTTIGNWAFYGNNIKELTVPPKVTTMGYAVMISNPNFNRLNLPNGLKTTATTLPNFLASNFHFTTTTTWVYDSNYPTSVISYY